MKLAGIAGKGSGRLGSMVFASTAGEQVVRQYQPSVSNPNTEAQVNNRAKLKLMSQVAAAVSGEIAIPRQGMKSSRNLFIKKNYDLAAAADGVATINYAALQFTNSSVALPSVNIERGTNSIAVCLSEKPAVSRVVYLCYKKTTEGALQFVASKIATEPDGQDGPFAVDFDNQSGDIVIYAYGMRDMSATASAKYGNYSVTDGTVLATLVMNRTLSASDYQFTATSGVTLFEGQDDTTTQNIVSVALTYPSPNGGFVEKVLQSNSANIGNVNPTWIDVYTNVELDGNENVTIKFVATDSSQTTFANAFVNTEGYASAEAPADSSVLAKAGKYVLTYKGVDFEMTVTAAA